MKTPLGTPLRILVHMDVRLRVSREMATKVLDACRDAGVAVPHAALVLGVDNDEFVCPHTPPSLSSAALCGFESDGYLKELFRRRFGRTMSDWRRAPPPR